MEENISRSISMKVWDWAEIQAFKWALLFLFFPTFLFAPTVPYFFLKMPYYPYLFTLKCHLRVRIQKFSSLASILEINLIFL